MVEKDVWFWPAGRGTAGGTGWSEDGWSQRRILRGGSSALGVTQYAALSELITASEGSLAAGYYEVLTSTGRVLTYWDGAGFDPYPVLPTNTILPLDFRSPVWSYQFIPQALPVYTPSVDGSTIDTGSTWSLV